MIWALQLECFQTHSIARDHLTSSHSHPSVSPLALNQALVAHSDLAINRDDALVADVANGLLNSLLYGARFLRMGRDLGERLSSEAGLDVDIVRRT